MASKKKVAKKAAKPRVRKPKAPAVAAVQYKEDPSVIDRIHAMEEGSVIEKHAQGFYVRPVVSGIKQHGFGKSISEAFDSVGAVNTP